jgi:hypothetical protein
MKTKQQKRVEAEARRTAHGLRTTAQQLKLLETRPGFAKKERAKLAKAKEQKKKHD